VLKFNNDKLIKYFNHDKLKKLIDYITVEPREDVSHARGHKYPFLSGEIFNCELSQILEKFFEAPEVDKDATPSEQARYSVESPTTEKLSNDSGSEQSPTAASFEETDN